LFVIEDKLFVIYYSLYSIVILATQKKY